MEVEGRPSDAAVRNVSQHTHPSVEYDVLVCVSRRGECMLGAKQLYSSAETVPCHRILPAFIGFRNPLGEHRCSVIDEIAVANSGAIGGGLDVGVAPWVNGHIER